MDAIFASEEEDGRNRLLRIMQDFLVSEAEKHTTEQKGAVVSFEAFARLMLSTDKAKQKAGIAGDVNMQELVGNTDGFADSG